MFDISSKDEPDLRSEAECFPDVEPGVEVVGDRVLVQLRREKTTSKGNQNLPQSTTTYNPNAQVMSLISMQLQTTKQHQEQ